MKKIKKADCLRIADEIAELLAKRLLIPKPEVRWEHGEARIGTDYDKIPEIVAMLPTGEVEVSADVDGVTTHIAIRYVGDMDDAKREVARYVGGNTYSGKLNWCEYTSELARADKLGLANLSAHLRGVMRKVDSPTAKTLA